MNVVLGLVFIGVGGLVIYYSRFFEKWFGRWDWAEQYLGGTAQGYVIIGFVLLIIGFLSLFGTIDLTK